MFGSKFWEEIFGEQIFFSEFFFLVGGGGGGVQNGEQFLLKANFLERKFWGQVLEERFV